MSRLLHEGTSFLISDESGNINPALTENAGLFYEDSRFLSHYELTLGGNSPLLLSSKNISDSKKLFFLTNGTIPGVKTSRLPPNNLVIVRTQTLREGFHEHIEITQNGDTTARFDLELDVNADFEHIYFVKQSTESGGASLPKHRIVRRLHKAGSAMEMRFQSGPVYRKCLMNFSRKPKWKRRSAVFHLVLERGQSWTLDIDVKMISGKKKKDQQLILLHQKKMSSSIANRIRKDFEKTAPILETDHPLLSLAYKNACEDLISLRMKATESLPRARAVAAGIPWYMALFGRDSLITSCQSLWVDPILARGTLRSLAHFQGKKHDTVSLEEPGKILHEYRESLIAGNHKAIPKFPYYGTIDATPLFVITLSEYCRWTGDLSLARELWPNVKSALQWMRKEGDPDGDGFLEYSQQKNGLKNQGWKDSNDSVRFSNGKVSRGPTALVEVQGYKIAALRRASELAKHLLNDSLPQVLESEANALEERLLQQFWLKQRSFFAEALDGSKTAVDSLTSNPGHLLWAECIPNLYAAHVAKRLFKTDLFNGYGIRTMGAHEGGYNPVSYHNGSVWPHENSLILAGLMSYGLRSHATQLTQALLTALACDPDARFSELFSGFPQKQYETTVGYPSACKPQAWASGAVIMILKQIMGIRANALEDTFEAHPLPLQGMSYIRLLGLHFNNRIIDINAKVHGKLVRVHVTQHEQSTKTRKAS